MQCHIPSRVAVPDLLMSRILMRREIWRVPAGPRTMILRLTPSPRCPLDIACACSTGCRPDRAVLLRCSLDHLCLCAWSGLPRGASALEELSLHLGCEFATELILGFGRPYRM